MYLLKGQNFGNMSKVTCPNYMSKGEQNPSCLNICSQNVGVGTIKGAKAFPGEP